MLCNQPADFLLLLKLKETGLDKRATPPFLEHHTLASRAINVNE